MVIFRQVIAFAAEGIRQDLGQSGARILRAPAPSGPIRRQKILSRFCASIQSKGENNSAIPPPSPQSRREI